MSFEGAVLSQMTNNGLGEKIERLIQVMERQILFQPVPRSLLKSNGNNLSSNFADGTIILDSAPVPPKHRFVVKNFDVNFSTTAGTVRIAVLGQDDSVRVDIARDITSTINGTGDVVLDEGERLAVVGQVAGAGTFGAYISGFVQRIRE